MWAVAALLLVVALAVRVPLLFYADDTIGYTDSFNLEEVENVRLSTGMLHKGTPHPHAFEYPSFFYYASAGVEAAARAIGRDQWRDYLHAVRGLSLLFGLATVLVVAWIGLRLGGPWAGTFAGAIYALDRTAIEISTLAKPNAAHVFFVVAGLAALVVLAQRPRLRTAVLAAALFGLAAGTKWLGGAAVLGLPPSAALSLPANGRAGVDRMLAALRAGIHARLPFFAFVLPLAAFGLAFLATTPGVLLSPREFGYGLAHVFTAQSEHRRALPVSISLLYLARALGPLATLACAVGFGWTVARLLRWRGDATGAGLWVLFGWTVAYGALVLFALARLPSYVDLWTPALAVLAGCAWVGREGLLRSIPVRALAVAAVLAGGIAAHGDDALALVGREAVDSRPAAARWLAAHASPSDTVLADHGVWVPDSLPNVWWNGWGGPPRVIYDETRTWGRDPRWPAWPGGHRRLWFEHAKWSHPESLLARRPRWVVVSATWRDRRREPASAHEPRLFGYDRALEDGRSGYVERARFTPRYPPDWNGWRTLALLRRTPAGVVLDGPEIVVYERRPEAPAFPTRR